MKLEYEGGYYLVNQPLVRSGINKHSTGKGYIVPQEVLDGVNTIQRTKWAVNEFILSAMSLAWEIGTGIGGIPTADPIPVPERIPESVWMGLTKEEQANIKWDRSALHMENTRIDSIRQAFLRKLELAQEMSQYREIYFPHFLDFRGRVYPIPQDLHPQGDDISRSLLLFAKGKPFREEGYRWLLISLANAYGQDKLSFDDRIAWTLDHNKEIIDSALNPVDGARFWAAEDANGSPIADEPWCFLALCDEYRRVSEEGTDALNYVPINIDGSCNGLQHLSAMGLDPVGARATNLTGCQERCDIYMEVAEEAKRIVSYDAAMGSENAVNWLGKIGRKTVKRAVMTTPYGVTDRGVRDQLIQDRFTYDIEGSHMKNAEYLTEVIKKALNKTISSAEEIMGYLQEVAGLLAHKGYPFAWNTPVDFHVCQQYLNVKPISVRTLYGRIKLWEEDSELGLNARKQRMGAAPNYIHSFDAAHLIKTVNHISKQGVDSFAMIHDSYGCHACDIPKMQEMLKESFIEIYREDWLEKLEGDIQVYAPEVQLPDRPKRGAFNIENVRDSLYFFS